MSHQLLFDEARRLLLVRFAGSLGPADFEALTADTRAFAQRHGGCDGIVDFSAVTSIDLPLDFMRTYSQQSRVMSGFRRVVVAPQAQIFGFARLYGLYQDNQGADQPLVVKTLAEAYAGLDLDAPSFRPVTSAGSLDKAG